MPVSILKLSKSTKEQQKKLYEHLEDSIQNQKKLVIYGSNLCDIDQMEKRVRSRFNNEVIYIDWISFELFRNVVFDNCTNNYKRALKTENQDFILNYHFCEIKNAKDIEQKLISNAQLKITDIKSIMSVNNRAKKISKNKINRNSNNKSENLFEKNKDIYVYDNSVQINNIQEINLNNYIQKCYNENPTLHSAQNINFYQKNNIEILQCFDFYNLFNNIQFIICIMCKIEKIICTNVISKFRKFTISINALKKIRNEDIMKSYLDLLEYNIIKKTFCGDWIGFEKFVKEKNVMYLNQLLRKRKI
ncbi:hypothetical protein COBT_001802 [Conglomerata obtusa]